MFYWFKIKQEKKGQDSLLLNEKRYFPTKKLNFSLWFKDL